MFTQSRLEETCLGGLPAKKQSFAVLDAYAAAGGNFIDTADVYSAWAPGNSGGESETILGRWIAKRGKRDQIIIATKVGKHPQLKGLSAKTIRLAAENSLKRLGRAIISTCTTHTRTTNKRLSKKLSARLMRSSAKVKYGTSPLPIIPPPDCQSAIGF